MHSVRCTLLVRNQIPSKLALYHLLTCWRPTLSMKPSFEDLHRSLDTHFPARLKAVQAPPGLVSAFHSLTETLDRRAAAFFHQNSRPVTIITTGAQCTNSAPAFSSGYTSYIISLLGRGRHASSQGIPSSCDFQHLLRVLYQVAALLQEVFVQAKLFAPLAVNLCFGIIQMIVIFAVVGQLGTAPLAGASIATQVYILFVKIPLLSLNGALDTKASQVAYSLCNTMLQDIGLLQVLWLSL